jgi:hypothetical protein
MMRVLRERSATNVSLRAPWQMIALLFATLAACNGGIDSRATPTTGISLQPDEPHVERQTLNELFDSAGSYLQTADDLEVIAFRCTIIEGTFCWFGTRPQDGAVLSDLARRVVDQVGSGAIENANRNEVSIQCYRPSDGGEPYCEIDWGWGSSWEPLPLD